VVNGFKKHLGAARKSTSENAGTAEQTNVLALNAAVEAGTVFVQIQDGVQRSSARLGSSSISFEMTLRDCA
jgi:hypothetical protein